MPAVALMAHYDSVPGSPGAADDGAGVASIRPRTAFDLQRSKFAGSEGVGASPHRGGG
ncbi:M28 family peptidase, partial [Novosphingobium sp. AP12]|uniref:M28 family peptidase n=1 Tax=Novosphingobium sp. AP12 TaxID=1144305 RepID=UPI00350F2CBC